MKVRVGFPSFCRKTMGIPFILLFANIWSILAAVRRPDARWIMILILCFVDAFSALEIGRVCRGYNIRTDGVEAIWFGIFRRFYPWSSFCSVSRENVNLGCRVVTHVICTQIPLKRQHGGMVDKEFLARHPFCALNIDMTEEQFAAFSALCPVPPPQQPQPRPID